MKKALDDDSFGLIQILLQSQFPHLQKPTEAHSPAIRAFEASTGLQIRKCGSVAGPGIKIRTEVVRIRVPSPYPSKNGRIRTLIFLCLCLFFSFDAF